MYQPMPQHSRARRALQWTAGGLGVSILLGALTVYSYQAGQRRISQENMTQKTGQTVSGEAVTEPELQEDYLYILREREGRLAVFRRGESEPQMIFDVPVRVLPQADQYQLAEGIRVKDYQTLVRRIEDYIS